MNDRDRLEELECVCFQRPLYRQMRSVSALAFAMVLAASSLSPGVAVTLMDVEVSGTAHHTKLKTLRVLRAGQASISWDRVKT